METSQATHLEDNPTLAEGLHKSDQGPPAEMNDSENMNTAEAEFTEKIPRSQRITELAAKARGFMSNRISDMLEWATNKGKELTRNRRVTAGGIGAIAATGAGGIAIKRHHRHSQQANSAMTRAAKPFKRIRSRLG